MVIGIDWNPDRHQIGISDRHRWNTQFPNESRVSPDFMVDRDYHEGLGREGNGGIC
jgi:hypothetical protein